MDLARCLMDICLQVINSSNMKRPVTTGASTLKDICKHVVKTGFSEECVLIFDVLEEALVLIMHSPTYCVSKIRCSSENRLVIHSICTSDTLPGKVCSKLMQSLGNACHRVTQDLLKIFTICV